MSTRLRFASPDDGRRGLYLEDLYVDPKPRGRGIGKALLHALAGIAVSRGCARMEWSVLDVNESVSSRTTPGAKRYGRWIAYASA